MPVPRAYRLKLCASGFAIVGTLAINAAALAQENKAPVEMDVAEEILVTGSRVAQTGYDMPTPVTVLGPEEIETQAPENIADFVNTLPSIAGSQTGSTNSGSLATGNAGISALSLRALGADRTLVLLGGRRSPSSSSSGLVDVNTMPQPLIERVEVVTGGASAAYGSGAIGGVVNFILDTDYTGLKGTAEYGETTYGDNPSHKFSLTGGMPFAGGRGHILVSGELSEVEGIHQTNRKWNTHGYFAMPNPNASTPGQPAYIVDYNIGLSGHTIGGLIVSGPLRGTYFGVDGVVNQLAYGEVGGQWMRGGDWQYTSHQAGTNSLQAGEKRASAFGRVSFELSPSLEIFGEASYAHFEGFSNYLRVETLRVPIRRDNAFLPAKVASAMDEAGITSFQMSTTNGDSAISGNNNKRETERYVIGAEGDFSIGTDIAWDFYYMHAVTKADQLYLPTIFHEARLAMATDAVIDPNSGNPVCRSTLTDPQNGCVPLNRFGVGVSTPEAWAYVSGAPQRLETYNLDVAAINFRPQPIEGWAGPISIAIGGEWRREEISGKVDPQYRSGWRFGNFQEDNGSYDVVEGYIEAAVPIGLGFDFNGAVRQSHYSTTGSITTWKAGLTFTPIDDVTFRATRSRDIRSPNLGELFATGTARGNTVPINGIPVAFQQKLQGSTKLDPEKADSWNVGVVVRPSFLPGFGMSIDYYDIKVKGVIGSVAAEQVTSFCFESMIQAYCDNMHFTDPSDPLTLTTIDLYYENLNSMKARGIDIEASYRFDMRDLIGGADGTFSLRAMATHYIDNISDNGVTAVDMAGSNAGGTPDWMYRVSATYDLEPWTFSLTGSGVSDGVISNAYIECQADCPASVFPAYTINDNSVDGQFVVDAYLARKFKAGRFGGQLFLSVQNLFNTDPPLVSDPASQGSASPAAYPQTNRSIYEYLGRTYRVGVRMEFQ